MSKIISRKWRGRFMSIAWDISSWSKDPSTGVGCVIASQDGSILSTGYNGLPRGVKDDPERMDRPQKYLWTAHAEENAIANAARNGTRVHGALAFVTHKPCARCAGMLINSGISAVFYGDGKTSMGEDEFSISEEKFKEAGALFMGS